MGAIDANMERVEAIANQVSYAMKADIEDADFIRSLGTRNLDGVVVAASDNMEASIMATLSPKLPNPNTAYCFFTVSPPYHIFFHFSYFILPVYYSSEVCASCLFDSFFLQTKVQLSQVRLFQYTLVQ